MPGPLRPDVEQVVAALRAHLGRALIALDFDGTLAPIVPDPSESRPVPGALDALRRLTGRGATVAVVTGRDAATVVRLGGLDEVPGLLVAGLYGIETWQGGELSTVSEPEPVSRLRDRLPAVVAAAVTDDRVWIEDKRLSLVVHARKAADPAGQIARVRAPVRKLAEELGLQVHDGRDVLEVRIPGYDKGRAMRELLIRTGARAVLFAGDDLGDLPAIEHLRQLRAAGRPAYSVAVRSAETPDFLAAADLAVTDPPALVALLDRISAP